MSEARGGDEGRAPSPLATPSQGVGELPATPSQGVGKLPATPSQGMGSARPKLVSSRQTSPSSTGQIFILF